MDGDTGQRLKPRFHRFRRATAGMTSVAVAVVGLTQYVVPSRATEPSVESGTPGPVRKLSVAKDLTKSAEPVKAAPKPTAIRPPVLFFQPGGSGHGQAIGAANPGPPDDEEIPEIPSTLPAAVATDGRKAVSRAAHGQRPDRAERETFLFFQPGGQVTGGTKIESRPSAARPPAPLAPSRSPNPGFLVFQPGGPRPVSAPARSEPVRKPAPAAWARVRKPVPARPGAEAKSPMIVFQPGKRAETSGTMPAPAVGNPKPIPAPAVRALISPPTAIVITDTLRALARPRVEPIPERRAAARAQIEPPAAPREPRPRIQESPPVASAREAISPRPPRAEIPAPIPAIPARVAEAPRAFARRAAPAAPAVALVAPQRRPTPVRVENAPEPVPVDARPVEVPLEVAVSPKPEPPATVVMPAEHEPREMPAAAVVAVPPPRPVETARTAAPLPRELALPEQPVLIEPVLRPAARPAVVPQRQVAVHRNPAPGRHVAVGAPVAPIPAPKPFDAATVAARKLAPEPQVVPAAVAAAPAPRTPVVPEVAAQTPARPKASRPVRPAPLTAPVPSNDNVVSVAAAAPPMAPAPTEAATVAPSVPVAVPAIPTPVASFDAPNADAVRLAAFFQEGATPLTPAAKKKVDELIESDPGDEVSLTIRARRSKVLRTKRPLIRTVISDPSLIEMVQFGPREFALIGKAEGTTNVTLWFDQENSETLTYLVTVLPDNEVENRLALKYKEMERMINALFPNSKIRLLAVGDKIIIRGQARDIREATNIYDLVKGQYAKLDKTNDNGKSNGASDAQGAAATGAAGAAGAPAAATIGAPPVANMGAPPVGATGLATTVQLQANGGGGGYGGGDPNDNSNVINMIEVPGEAQIMLKVRIAEVKRTAMRALGANFAVNPTGTIGNFFYNSALANGANPAAVFSNNDVSALINALSANNTMKILAEPNLVTLSGRPATFLSGGSFPVPTAVGLGGIGAASTFFQGYGTQLFFLPTILDKDRIRLQVTPSMSSLDRSTTVNGIPGLTLNTAFTTVDLREGQWLAIAGLLVDRQNGTNSRVPLLGEIPALKVLFANKSIKREETELIVLVSPVLVHPLEPKQAPALLPGMDITEPDNWDFFINNRWEGRPDIQYRSTVAPIIKQRIRDARHGDAVQGAEDYYIQGPRGFSR